MVQLSHLYMTPGKFLASVDFLRDAHFEPLGCIFSLPSYTDWWGFYISHSLGRAVKYGLRDFCDSPVVVTLSFHSRGHRFNPWSGNRSHMLQKKQNKQTKKTTRNRLRVKWKKGTSQRIHSVPTPDVMLILGIPVNRPMVHSLSGCTSHGFLWGCRPPYTLSSHYSLLLLRSPLSVLHRS